MDLGSRLDILTNGSAVLTDCANERKKEELKMSLTSIQNDYLDPDKHLWQEEAPESYQVVLDFFSAKDEEQAKHFAYKYTDCGAWLEFYDYGIKIGSIVEGCDFGTAIYVLRYKDDFTKEDIQKRIDAVEHEANEIWKWANAPCTKTGKPSAKGKHTQAELGLDAPGTNYNYRMFEQNGRSG